MILSRYGNTAVNIITSHGNGAYMKNETAGLPTGDLLFVIRVSFFYPTLYLASLTLLRSPKRLSNDETISRRMAT